MIETEFPTNSLSSNAGMSYRADIDGLRALAVALVVAYHAFPKWISGGYIGVDIFFVISGYLITNLIIGELARKRFSFSDFYARRVRRIFPALILVLGGCFVVGWFLLLPSEFISLGLNILGGASFASNFILLHQADYFDIEAARKPLLHLWSLGIEEQFYIFWPACVVLAWRLRWSVTYVAAVLLLCSFAWNIALKGSAADFYLPMTRAWELMTGAILTAGGAITIWQHWLLPNRLALAGAVAIAIPVALLDGHSAFPGWWAVLPVFGTASFIAAEGSWINRTILSQRHIVAIGVISYPLYLWHWPLLSFATITSPQGVAPITRVAIVAISLALAALTYSCVERPIRLSNWRLKIATLCALMLAAGAAGTSTVYSQGFAFRVPTAFQDTRTTPLNEAVEWRRGMCLLDQGDGSPSQSFSPNCVEQQRPLLFLWGDSISASLYPGLKSLQSSHEFGIAQFSTAGCPPILNFSVLHRPRCVEDNAAAFATLKKARPDVVLLFSMWDYGNVYAPLHDLVSKLRALKIPRIIVMGPTPVWEGGLTKAAYDYYKAVPLHRMIPMYSNFRLQSGWGPYDATLAEQVKSLGVEYISTWNALCTGDQCRTWTDFSGGQLTEFDEDHLSIAGSHFLADAIMPCLFPAPQVSKPSFCH